ncbi:MAG: UvrD-helicase domain-containing protein, partial [Candidatus Margulisiibacteriota bacterium]
YLSLLLSGVPYESILVVTFTRKATAQIRSRVFGHLRMLCERSPEGRLEELQSLQKNLCAILPSGTLPAQEAIRNLYENLLIHKHQVRIQTLDGVVNWIFSELIAPHLQLYNPMRIDESINEETYMAVFLAMLSDPSDWKILREFLAQSNFQKSLLKYERLIANLVQNRWKIEQLRALPLRDISAPSCQVLQENLNELLGRLEKESNDLPSSLKSGWDFLLTYWRDQSEASFARLMRHKSSRILKEDYCWKKVAFKSQHVELLEQYNALKKGLSLYLFEERMSPYIAKLHAVAERVNERYDEIKMSQKRFTYQDILFYTFRYLYSEELSLIDRDNDMVLNEFYERLSARIRYVLIDEFQDTSLLQWKILAPLITENISDETQPGGVIVVGDEKQAIYGWRGGEMSLLTTLPKMLRAPTLLTLGTSYRSTPLLIKTINAMFGAIPSLTNAFGSYQWHYDPVRSASQSDAGYVEISVVRRQQSDEPAIRQFVLRIKEAMEHSQLSLSQTAILVRTNAEMEKIALYAENEGLNIVRQSASSLLDYPAVKPILKFLTYLRYREFADLLAFLRSDLIGMSSSQMAVLLETYRSVDPELRQDLSTYEGKNSWVDQIALFLQTRECSQPLPLLLLNVIEFFKVSSVFPSVVDSKNLERLIEIVQQIYSKADGEPKTMGFLLDELEKNRKTEMFRQTGLEQRQAIQIMTVHKAKGLEFENVFFYWDVVAANQTDIDLQAICVYDETFRVLQDGVIYPAQDQVILRNINQFKPLLAKEYEKNRMESINELYVACTRSKSCLWIMAVVRRNVEEIAKLSGWTYQQSEDAYYVFKEMVGAVAGETLFETDTPPFVIGMLPKRGEPPLERADATTNWERISPYLQTQTRRVPPRELPADIFKVARVAYRIEQNRGTIVHHFLSHIYHGHEWEMERAQQSCYLLFGETLRTKEWPILFESLQKFILEHQSLFEMRWHVWTEQAVFCNDKMYRIDRLMRDPVSKDIWIVDYKTGEQKDPMQLETYKRAINLLFTDYKIRTGFIEVLV